MRALEQQQKTTEENKVEGERSALPLTLSQGDGGSVSDPEVQED